MKHKKKNENIKSRAIKYRLYPDSKQKETLENYFGCCRKVWNLMLSDRIDYYKQNKKSLHPTPTLYKKKEEFKYLKEVDSLALANVQLNLEESYRRFFEKISGFPKFKSKKKSKNSYTTNNQGNTIEIKDSSIKLPKIGWLKINNYRKPEDTWKIKSATVSKDKDCKYYVSVLFEYENKVEKLNKNEVIKAIGLDYKSDGFYCDDTGKVCGSPKFYRKSQKKLARFQRRFSRKVVGSNNKEKQRIKIAKLSRKVANQRLDFLHKKSFEIANQYDLVCIEDLNMQAMSQGLNLGKSTLDNGWGKFVNFLEYKLKDRGKYLIKVDKWFPSSKTCSCCGNKYDITLKERVYNCPHCKISIDRETNAAINIKREGLRIFKTL